MGMTKTKTEEWRGKALSLEKLADIIRRDGISQRDWAFLDSSLKGRDGRYSILGLYPYLRADERDGELLVNGEKRSGDLLNFLKHYIEDNREQPENVLEQDRDGRGRDALKGKDLQSVGCAQGRNRENEGPVMTGGAIGWLSYDYGRKRAGIAGHHESSALSVDGGLPDGRFVFYDLYLVEDLQESRIWMCTQEKLAGISDYREKVRTWAEKDRKKDKVKDGNVVFSSDYDREAYENTIRRVIEYMRAGDIYVMNMTRRITADHIGDPYQMFRYLRKHNPSPFGAFLSFGEYQIVCASPERFLRVRNGVVETSPIKGTRKRGITEEEDQKLKQELADSEKDKSELLMIVDLERNDLNRVCVPGSVKVPRMYYIESFATVHHLISDVTGELRPECSAVDLLDAAFPGGSITGAPKYRAMEIIEEQENSARGLYTGTIGYLGLDGNCDFNIVIRTAVCRNGSCTIGAGGGITVDSDPEFEYEETNQKAAALIEAIRMTKE